MTPLLSKYQLEILNTEFYTNMNFFGRDKLYTILRKKYPEHPSRRQNLRMVIKTRGESIVSQK
jgi:hypothetical protein